MGSLRWTGNAQAISQLTKWVVNGTWATNDTITATINGKVVTFTVRSTTTTAAVAAGLLAAIQNSNIAEFGEQTWAVGDGTTEIIAPDGSPFTPTTSTIYATGNTQGYPFTATLAKGTSAAGTVDGASSSTGTDQTACSGPNFWNVAKNWDSGAVPVTGDDVYFDNNNTSVLYGLANSGVLLNSLTISLSYTGNIGLSKINQAGGYNEYRADYLAIGFQGLFQLRIGTDTGNGSNRIKINSGSTKMLAEIFDTGAPTDPGLGAVLLKGTHASNTLEVKNGSVDVAPFGAELATILTLRVTGGNTRITQGVTLGSVVQGDGNLLVTNLASATIAAITMDGGTCQVEGTGALTTGTLTGGTLIYNSAGTISTMNIGNNAGTLQRTDDSPCTISQLNVKSGATISDKYQAFVYTAIAFSNVGSLATTA